jgi:hypothetical protein
MVVTDYYSLDIKILAMCYIYQMIAIRIILYMIQDIMAFMNYQKEWTDNLKNQNAI